MYGVKGIDTDLFIGFGLTLLLQFNYSVYKRIQPSFF